MWRVLLPLALASWPSAGASPDYASARRKIDNIKAGKVARGSVVVFSPAELIAYALTEAKTVASDGIRQPRLILSRGRASAYALVDFMKLRRSSGGAPNWLLDGMLKGERPMEVSVRLVSANGHGTVIPERVQISRVAVTGAALEFLITSFILPIYPNAKVDEPFEIGYDIERYEITPAQARVVMKK